MAAGNNDINRSLGVPIKNEKLCTIRYTGRTYNATVIATGCLTTLETLQEEFPGDDIQACQEDNIEYYKKVSKDGPKFFAYHRDGTQDKAYYWDDGHWNGYKTLKSVEISTVSPRADESCTSTISQESADDRRN
jgi:hypothetical protein